MKRALICGGRSCEHEISIISALDLYNKDNNYIFLYLNKRNELFYFKEPSLDNIISGKGKKFSNFLVCYKKLKIDIFILLVHGYGVEDGSVSGILDFYNLPYIGSKLGPSYKAMDKEISYYILKENKINQLPKEVLKDNDFKTNYPVIVKPAYGGSSLGVFVAYNRDEFDNNVDKSKKISDKLIVEPYLEDCYEIFVGVYKDDDIKISKAEIIKPKNKIFDYDQKYKNREKGSHHEFVLDEKLLKTIEELSRKVYNAFEFDGIVRIDFLYKHNRLFVNEINTIPGSLANYLFDDFDEVLNSLIKKKLYLHKKIINNQELDQELIKLNSKF